MADSVSWMLELTAFTLLSDHTACSHNVHKILNSWIVRSQQQKKYNCVTYQKTTATKLCQLATSHSAQLGCANASSLNLKWSRIQIHISGSLRIHYIVGILLSIAKTGLCMRNAKSKSPTIPTPQRWGKWKSELESICRTGSLSKVNKFFQLVDKAITPSCNETGGLLLQ